MVGTRVLFSFTTIDFPKNAQVDDTEEVAMEIDSDDNGGGGAGDWRAVTDSSEASSSRKGRAAILEEEPDLQQGVAAAITVADRKG